VLQSDSGKRQPARRWCSLNALETLRNGLPHLTAAASGGFRREVRGAKTSFDKRRCGDRHCALIHAKPSRFPRSPRASGVTPDFSCSTRIAHTGNRLLVVEASRLSERSGRRAVGMLLPPGVRLTVRTEERCEARAAD